MFNPASSGVFIEAGNALSSSSQPMTLETQMTLAVLQVLLMALGGYGLFSYILYKVAEFSQ
jgi:hypothetical protein